MTSVEHKNIRPQTFQDWKNIITMDIGMGVSSLKILLFDIETAPNLGYIWGKWEQDVIENKQDWYMLSVAYKWLGGKTKTLTLPDFKGYKHNPEDDSKLVKALWELFNEADLIIAHNGDNFDIKKANARFIQYGLTPPKPYKTIDTLKAVRKSFRFDSNRLDDLGNYLGVGRKAPTNGFKTWKGCMQGDSKAWKTMKTYNAQDVELLERVFLKLRPWITFPNCFNPAGRCPNCDGKLHKRGYQILKGGHKQRLQCQECGAWTTSNLIRD